MILPGRNVKNKYQMSLKEILSNLSPEVIGLLLSETGNEIFKEIEVKPQNSTKNLNDYDIEKEDID